MDKDVAESLSFYAPLDGGLCAFGVGSTTPTFTRATAATYVNPTTGLISQAASGVARFEAAGMLIEGSRTNQCPEILDSSWVDLNMTRTALSNSDISDYQTNKAASVSATGAGGTSTHVFVLGSTQEEFYLYLKRITGTGGVSISTDTVTWTAVTITTSWVRYGVTQTLANPTIGIKLATSGDVIGVWGVQLEAGTYASSYITTTTAAATRNADVLNYIYSKNGPGAGLPGTAFVIGSISTVPTAVNAPFLTTLDSTPLNGIGIVSTSGLPQRPRYTIDTASNQMASNAASGASDFVSGNPQRLAFAYATNDGEGYSNGSSLATDTSLALPTQTRINVGAFNDGGQSLVNVKYIYQFIRRFSSPEIKRLQ